MKFTSSLLLLFQLMYSTQGVTPVQDVCNGGIVLTIPSRVRSVLNNSPCKFHVEVDYGVGIILTPRTNSFFSSYLYTRIYDSKYTDCYNKSIVSISDIEEPCVLYFSSSRLELNLIDNDADMELFKLDIEVCDEVMKLLDETQSASSLSKCNTTLYDEVINFEITEYEEEIGVCQLGITYVLSNANNEYSYFPLNDTSESSEYDPKSGIAITFPLKRKCPSLCTCHLGYKNWVENCPKQLRSYLIIYPNDVIIMMNISSVNVFTISSNALNGLDNLKVLRLIGNKLSNLPNNIFAPLRKLKCLDLRDSELMSDNHVKSVFDPLVDLNFLSLSFNQISEVSDNSFYLLINLLGLQLSSNNLTYLNRNVFVSQRGLKELSLQNNMLTDFPNGIFDPLSDLYFLNLADNQLISLPDTLFYSMTELLILFLSGNVLVTLPRTLFISQRKLQILFLQNNMLEHLPSGIFDYLNNLELLMISDNYLRSLPNRVFIFLHCINFLFLHNNYIEFQTGMLDIQGDCLNLQPQSSVVIEGMESYFFRIEDIFQRRFDLGNNGIVTLDSDIFHNVNISQLQIHNNYLTALSPKIFLTLHMLTELIIRNNSLLKLPDKLLEKQVNLVYLDLAYNQISFLPDNIFSSLHQLKTLKLKKNTLTTINESIFTSQNVLTILDLARNVLTGMPYNIFHPLVNLEILDLLGNKIRILYPSTFKNCLELRVLRLSENNIEQLSQNTFRFTKKLNILFLNQNRLSSLHYGVFDSLEELENLDLSFNNLTRLSDHVFNLTIRLEYLNLTQNKLTSLPLFLTLHNLTILDLSFNRLNTFTSETFNGLVSLKYLSISHNYLKNIPAGVFNDVGELIFLNLSANYLAILQSDTFINQHNLLTLSLSSNVLSRIQENAFLGLKSIVRLDLDRNDISDLNSESFRGLENVKCLNVSHNKITRIYKHMFKHFLYLKNMDLRQNKMYFVKSSSFIGLERTNILVDNYATCCFVPNKVACISENPKPAYLTCQRMLTEITLRISMWCLGLSAVMFNSFVFYSRLRGKVFVQTTLILHLSMSDFLMGVNMLFIASADAYYGDLFPSFSDMWRGGIPCKIAGTLSILSSEASVFFITLISFDRLFGVKYPFSSHRLTVSSAKKWALVIWMISINLSLFPNVLSWYFEDIFEVSEVCVGLPIVKRPVTEIKYDSVEWENIEFRADVEYESYYVSYLNGIQLEQEYVNPLIPYLFSSITNRQLATYFSMVLFIGVNLLCFICVAFCYIQILFTARETAKKAHRTQAVERELRLTIKSSALVFTDFCCWVPLAIVCVLVQCGYINVSPAMYAWTVAFILPINSSINPFLYTLSSSMFDYFNRKKSEKKTDGTTGTTVSSKLALSKNKLKTDDSIRSKHM